MNQEKNLDFYYSLYLCLSTNKFLLCVAVSEIIDLNK